MVDKGGDKDTSWVSADAVGSVNASDDVSSYNGDMAVDGYRSPSTAGDTYGGDVHVPSGAVDDVVYSDMESRA